ncbi:hypothetical protein [Sphingopyxis sp. MSC1_008]|jgi:hypothetical protein|uniref:hypothetical protein n=1 Tax=Sphingopyxis sp. MSC1_008 TaxID=2909265 RepID=UPI0020BF02E4|nr:hypothetical protein [Sphingopyxis sp. MSC1_008]
MTVTSDTPTPQAEPGVATAEDGVVLLDGPDGLALTLTPDAAERTGQSLIDAAATARTQSPPEPDVETEDE